VHPPGRWYSLGGAQKGREPLLRRQSTKVNLPPVVEQVVCQLQAAWATSTHTIPGYVFHRNVIT